MCKWTSQDVCYIKCCLTAPPCPRPGVAPWEAAGTEAFWQEQGQGLLEPNSAPRQVGGHTVHCGERVASVQRSRSSFDWQIGFNNALLPTACLLSSQKTESQDVCAEPWFRYDTFLTGDDSRTKVFRSDRFTCLSTTLHWWPWAQRLKSGHPAPRTVRGLSQSLSQSPVLHWAVHVLNPPKP